MSDPDDRWAELRQRYLKEPWGMLAHAAGYDPVNTESSARHAFGWCADKMQEMILDPEKWARAEAEMEWYHSQVQGFVYEDAETGGNLHVVRDLTLPPQVGQRVWTLLEDQAVVRQSEKAATAEYERCHRLMLRAIRVRQIAMTRTHYLWGVTSGAFEREEGQ